MQTNLRVNNDTAFKKLAKGLQRRMKEKTGHNDLSLSLVQQSLAQALFSTSYEEAKRTHLATPTKAQPTGLIKEARALLPGVRAYFIVDPHGTDDTAAISEERALRIIELACVCSELVDSADLGEVLAVEFPLLYGVTSTLLDEHETLFNYVRLRYLNQRELPPVYHTGANEPCFPGRTVAWVFRSYCRLECNTSLFKAYRGVISREAGLALVSSADVSPNDVALSDAHYIAKSIKPILENDAGAVGIAKLASDWNAIFARTNALLDDFKAVPEVFHGLRSARTAVE